MSEMITIKKSEYDRLKKYEKMNSSFMKDLAQSVKEIKEGKILNA